MERQKFHIYCDESSQTAHRYTMIGATFCRADAAPVVAAKINETISSHAGNEPTELKWTKIKKHNLSLYKDVAADCFEFMDAKMLHYRCLVIDGSKANHRVFSDGDKELGFVKFEFWLLYSFVQKFGDGVDYCAFIDERNTRFEPETTQCILNNKAKTDFSRRRDPFKSVKYLDFQEEQANSSR